MQAYLRSVDTVYADGTRRGKLARDIDDPDTVWVTVRPNGAIMWSDDWCKLSDWYLAGQLNYTYRNGHGDPYAQELIYYAVPFESKGQLA